MQQSFVGLNDFYYFMQKLPDTLYTANQTRQLEHIAITQCGMPGFTLMRRAGKAAFQQLIQSWPHCTSISIICGTGNNGGDGYIVARLAQQYGIKVQLIQVGDNKKLSGDAAQAYQFAREVGISAIQFTSDIVIAGDLIVDALLGTGLTGEVKEPFLSAIKYLNKQTQPIFSIDIPSGLCSDTGMPLGCAVEASKTITFIGLKQGLLTASGPHYAGKLYFDNLQIPSEAFQQVDYSCLRVDVNNTLTSLPKRRRDSHKGDFGHVLIIGGDYGMAGAIVMAAEAAARVGAGLTSVITRPEHVAALIAHRPEIMAYGYPLPSNPKKDQLTSLLEQATVIVVGPGLGQSDWSKQLFQQVLSTNLPLIIDADGLNLIANEQTIKPRNNWILTPHPGEAARLLQTNTGIIQQDRFYAAHQLQQKYNGVCILKGSGTLIAYQNKKNTLALCNAGNPGMASGGMGDVLSGLLGGLIAQKMATSDAAKLSVCLHASAADFAAKQYGERGLLATDLLPFVRKLINQ